jgi:hypothetical protein
MMSPLARPATSAGNPRCTPITRTPVSSWSWFSRANAREILRTPMPQVSETHSSPIRLSSLAVTRVADASLDARL